MRILLPSFFLTLPVFSVLRFPDEFYDVRWPLTPSDCSTVGRLTQQQKQDSFPALSALVNSASPWSPDVVKSPHAHREKAVRSGKPLNPVSSSTDCFEALKVNVLDDLNCEAVVPSVPDYVPHFGDRAVLQGCEEFVSLYQTTFEMATELQKGGGSDDFRSHI